MGHISFQQTKSNSLPRTSILAVCIYPKLISLESCFQSVLFSKYEPWFASNDDMAGTKEQWPYRVHHPKRLLKSLIVEMCITVYKRMVGMHNTITFQQILNPWPDSYVVQNMPTDEPKIPILQYIFSEDM